MAAKATKFLLEENGKQTCAYCGGVLQLIEGCGLEAGLLAMIGFYEAHTPCGDLLLEDKIPLFFMKLYELREKNKKQRAAGRVAG